MSTIAPFPASPLKQVTPERGPRYYETPEGVRLPSVTAILSVISKPALVGWSGKVEREMVIEAAADLYADLPLASPRMNRMAYIDTLQKRIGKTRAHQKKLREASDIGSAAHARIEWELRHRLGQKQGPEPVVQGPAMWAFQAWLRWWDGEGMEPVAIEQQVWSTSYGYAGTMDLLARDRGLHLAMVDWKTGKAIYPEAWLQNAAYAVAVGQMGHGPVHRHIILRLPKTESDPDFEVKELKNPHKAFKAFLIALELYKWQQTCQNDEAA